MPTHALNEYDATEWGIPEHYTHTNKQIYASRDSTALFAWPPAWH